MITVADTASEQTFWLTDYPLLDINITLPGVAGNGAAIGNRFLGAPDTAYNKLDVAVLDSAGTPIGDLVINSLDAPNGVLKVQYTAAPGTGAVDGYVVYWTSTDDTAGIAQDPISDSRVYVKSQADAGGIGVVVTETGANTGVFESSLKLCSTAGCTDHTASPPMLQVGASDVVTFSYNDANGSLTSASVTVESDSAQFSNFSPDHNSATTSSLPIVSGEITDAASGVKKASARVKFNVGGTVTEADPNEGLTGSIATIAGGYAVQQRNPTAITDGDILWWLKADDEAGNPGVSDRVSPSGITGTVDITAGGTGVSGTGTAFLTEVVVGQTITVAGETRKVVSVPLDTSLTVDDIFNQTLTGQPALISTCVPSEYNLIGTPTAVDCYGCDPYVVKVDNSVPDMTSATTGPWWDITKTVTDKTEVSPAKALTTSVLVRFNEAIDPTTVQPNDFTVGGVMPVGAELNVDTGTTAGCSAGITGCGVFLTVSVMAPDAKPDVKLIGQVKDIAGNQLTIDQVTASDGIAPTITATVVGTAASRPVTNGPVSIQFSTDEAATVGATSVIVKPVVTKTTLGGQVGTFTPTLVTSQTWKVDYNAASAGVFNVYVTAMDLSGNIGETGHATDPSNSAAILFEVDKTVPAPSFVPSTSTDKTDPFISVDFASEGKEYGLNAGGTFTNILANVVTNYDTHGTLTLTSATLDGVNILSDVVTEDNVIFLYKASGLALGDHTIKVKAKDASGNGSAEFSQTFEVTERAAFKLRVRPGMNLLSLPGQPETGAIDDVFGAASNIDLVVTYDPGAAAGPWLIAQRNPVTGLFEGTLSTIDGVHAYWIRSDAFMTVEVFIAEMEYDDLPPTVPVRKGWNLIPVTDVALSPTGSTMEADSYLAGVSWTVGWSFDTIANRWDKISYGMTPADTVAVGSGYWLWASSAGNITP
jgi:hypothetical protein